MVSLDFDTLREANMARLPRFRDKHGRLVGHLADASDWSPADWLEAFVGELGELANNLKKVRRGDYTMEEMRPKIEEEFADIQTYLDIYALRCGVDLGKVTVKKFNEVSQRVGAGVFIEEHPALGYGVEVVAKDG